MSKAKPEKVIRIGSISASVFSNEVGEGESRRTLRNVSIQRNYKSEDGKWKSTNAFGLAELTQVKEVVGLAIDYVANLEADATPTA